MDTLELLAHPVRLRIVHALRGGHVLTTGQLCARIPDTSKAMVYRHVDLLAANGILEVAEERRVRGAVERRYRLRQDRTVIDADALAALSRDDHRRVFATSMAVLVAEFDAYLDHENADPIADLISYRQHAVWLTRGELEKMISELRRVIFPLLANEPAPDRTQHLLSPIFFPIEQLPAGSVPGTDDGGPSTS
ncbi:helix-turn-helix domain-containing protein [Microbispora cellulosiformans]|uniref:Helix-turn-helix domain-containing protein n=1 Tax=Microbispora cellulosiformans TaxID=2614688 RepID=A0A5J5JUX4_9ACTN|nr:helix-turn-helix domain-containing protein [Microbispora cellulosiformans]KAA9373770.1 helix-turn-helix domain-containing protein [Microbispora cellulosiformans]